MNQKEKNLIANLLEMASNEFSNHGCNDYRLKGWTKEECRELDRKMHEWNGDPEEHCLDEDHSIQMDWCLMAYFANKIRS
jgi:hypothetical protein